VDQSAADVRHESERPEHQQDHQKSPEHVSPPGAQRPRSAFMLQAGIRF
jgi:hypothetical protein